MSEKIKNIICIICGVLIIYCIISGIIFGRQSNELRSQLDTAQRELSTTTEINKQLTDELSRSRETLERERAILEKSRADVTKLGNTTKQNIRTIDDCIRLVEEIRNQVQDLEMDLYNRDTGYSANLHSNNDSCNL